MAIRGGMDAKATASKDGTPTLPSRGALPQPGLWLTLLLRPVASWSGQQLPLPVLGAATIRTTHVFHKVLPARDLNLPKTQMRERSNHSAGKDWASTHRVQLDPGKDPASPQHSPWLCARPAPTKRLQAVSHPGFQQSSQGRRSLDRLGSHKHPQTCPCSPRWPVLEVPWELEGGGQPAGVGTAGTGERRVPGSKSSRCPGDHMPQAQTREGTRPAACGEGACPPRTTAWA